MGPFLEASDHNTVSPDDLLLDIEESKGNRGLPHGIKPSNKEVEEHERTHVPFRSWCAHGVKGKGKSHPHWNKLDVEDVGIPVISWDYFFMRDEEDEADADIDGEEDEKTTPIIAWHDSNSKGSMAYAVPRKGECEYAIRRAVQDVCKILGYNRMIFKGDQEPALRTFMDRTKMLCGDQCVLEESPVGESQSNGAIENAIQGIEGQFRAMRSDLETCYNRIVPSSHPCRPWLIRHASGTAFREKIGNDGFTAYKRVKGKEFRKELVKFGECVWYIRPLSKGKAKAQVRWENGIFLGIRDESGEYIVGTKEGVIKVRTVRRKGSNEERWNWEEFSEMKGVPWEPVPGSPEREMESRIGGPRRNKEILKSNEGEVRESVKREFRIERNDVRKHGSTEG